MKYGATRQENPSLRKTPTLNERTDQSQVIEKGTFNLPTGENSLR